MGHGGGEGEVCLEGMCRFSGSLFISVQLYVCFLGSGGELKACFCLNITLLVCFA